MSGDKRLGENPTIITLGLGQVVVATGYYDGLPCLWFAKPQHEGKVGQSAIHELNEHGGLNDPVVIRFENMEAVLSHLDRIKAMVGDLEKRVGVTP